jgi:hypothetical protein
MVFGSRFASFITTSETDEENGGAKALRYSN